MYINFKHNNDKSHLVSSIMEYIFQKLRKNKNDNNIFCCNCNAQTFMQNVVARLRTFQLSY